VAPGALVYPGVTFDLEQGAVVVAEGATIRPGAIIHGPASIGAHSTVLDRALVKGFTAIGPYCKVAGEIGGTIIQGYSNKAHDGHLGDSWLGEWVNLGAGTTNSNLLNTYGEVFAKAAPDASNERTGLQFLGCILGDHVKTAICTRIMTGAIVGTGTMWAATAPVSGSIPAFSWVTDAGTKGYRFEKFMEVARAAMGRRKIDPSTDYARQLEDLAKR
jgi:UDP-N-acetylglucosamine diphosphorylase/glucosamine-1-phosphate N-acetyltransferase